jgi:hypothetical protein
MVDGDQYVERVISVMKQCEMARNALGEFRDDPIKQEQIAQDAVSSFLRSFRKMVAKAMLLSDNEQSDGASAIKHDTPSDIKSENIVYGIHSEHEHVRTQLRSVGDDAKAEFVSKVQVALNRINQNELIMLVALFETQMKAIHREVLRQEPSLLSADRSVPLGKLISEGFERTIESEIDREVQSLDRKAVDGRAAYFQVRLRLHFDDSGEMRGWWQKMIDARNGLLHEDPDMTITEDQLKAVRDVVLFLPFRHCQQCVTRYPQGFRQWDGWLTTDWSSYDVD